MPSSISDPEPGTNADGTTWLDLITAFGVLVSLVLSVYLFLVQRWSAREASIGARLEQSEIHRSAHLVITNYGPHSADDVGAVIQSRGGGEPKGLIHIHQAQGDDDAKPEPLVNDLGEITPPELPLPRLNANESYYIYGMFQVLGAGPAQATLTWRDGRRRRQTKTVQLSIHPV